MNDGTYNSQCFELDESPNTTTKSENNTTNNLTEIEENESITKPQPLWSIDDDTLFYPLGLINHGTDVAGKSVFLTWSEDYLLNFVFKTNARTQKTKLTKVRLPMPDNEVINEIHILQLNTLLLMQSGRVYYFSSVKAMHAIPWLTGVRCMCAIEQGFSVIRLLPEKRLSLEVYADAVNLGKIESTLLRSFDITFDEHNLFNCQWQDEQLTLLTLTAQTDNAAFLQHIIGLDVCKLHNEQKLHFFTVSGSVFALIEGERVDDVEADTTDYHIQLLNSYASNVAFIKILCAEQLCLIFLECGVIDIWYMSLVAQALQRNSHQTGTQFTHYDFCARNVCCYFTDEQRVARLQFTYDAAADVCAVQETYKSIAGIIACTWVDSIQQLICLNCNNIFYQLSFDANVDTTTSNGSKATPKSENLHALYELTTTHIKELLQKAQLVNELAQVPAQLHAAIEAEFVKQQLIAVAHKARIYKRLFKAHVSYTTPLSMPAFSNDTIVMYTHKNILLHSNSFLALLHLQIICNDVFQATRWYLHINYNGNLHQLPIPHAHLYKEFCIVMPLERVAQQRLPEFQCKLHAYIVHDESVLTIALPIELNCTPQTYCKLFSSNSKCLTINCTHNLANLIARFNKSQVNDLDKPQQATITHTLSMPKAFTFKHILETFNATNNVTAVDKAALDLYFMSRKLKLTFSSTCNCLKLESDDAFALYYAKLYLLHNFERVQLFPASVLNLQTTLLQFQCDIERAYGTFINNIDDISAEYLQLGNLQAIYTKLRAEFCKLSS